MEFVELNESNSSPFAHVSIHSNTIGLFCGTCSIPSTSLDLGLGKQNNHPIRSLLLSVSAPKSPMPDTL